MTKYSVALLLLLATLFSCQRKSDNAEVSVAENKQAKGMMQGVWIDAETEEVSFKVKGDTVFFPDSTSQPAYFRIVADSIQLGNTSYPIVKQTAHLFVFKNPNGDVVKLQKSTDPDDMMDFDKQVPPQILTLNEVVKTDSVVMYGNQRYHWYIAVNPTRYKVQKTAYNDDGVEIQNVYYDNIIHISLYQGARQLFSRDFKKQMYAKNVPDKFLSQAILGNMQYNYVDASGFHFNATLCIPDGASCYLVETLVGFDGRVGMKLLER